MSKQFFILPFLFGSLFLWLSCSQDPDLTCELTQEQIAIQKTIPHMAIIAHRGTCYWAPEGTEAAIRWARNTGADYLECDLQRTKDGYLVIYHDLLLTRTSDVSKKFPERINSPISDFTLEELFSLDIGTWFNTTHSVHARESFKGLDILTLEDVIKIAEGYRIRRDAANKRIYTHENGKIVTLYEQDPADNGNRPGIYPETKKPELYPGIETDLKNELERLGWYSLDISSLKVIKTQPNRVQTGNTCARVIVQTFSTESLKKLRQAFPRLIPFCFLVVSNANENISTQKYSRWINYAISQGAVIIGPSIYEKDSELGDLLTPWMHDMIKEKKLLIHAYTFNTLEQMQDKIDLVDGFFTNETDLLVAFLLRSGKMPSQNSYLQQTAASITLDHLGY